MPEQVRWGLTVWTGRSLEIQRDSQGREDVAVLHITGQASRPDRGRRQRVGVVAVPSAGAGAGGPWRALAPHLTVTSGLSPWAVSVGRPTVVAAACGASTCCPYAEAWTGRGAGRSEGEDGCGL
jgi:hypothetical protein